MIKWRGWPRAAATTATIAVTAATTAVAATTATVTAATAAMTAAITTTAVAATAMPTTERHGRRRRRGRVGPERLHGREKRRLVAAAGAAAVGFSIVSGAAGRLVRRGRRGGHGGWRRHPRRLVRRLRQRRDGRLDGHVGVHAFLRGVQGVGNAVAEGDANGRSGGGGSCRGVVAGRG